MNSKNDDPPALARHEYHDEFGATVERVLYKSAGMYVVVEITRSSRSGKVFKSSRYKSLGELTRNWPEFDL